MRSLALAAALVLLSSSAALADDPTDKAAHFARTEPGKLDEVRGFALPGVRGYTHAVFSREPREGFASRHLVLMRCARLCEGTRVGIAGSDELRVVGLIDLAGAARDLPVNDVGRIELPGSYVDLPRVDRGRAKLRWPALLVVEASTHSRDETLLLISLRAADRGRVILREPILARAATGAGMSATYRLADERARTPHTIVAIETRHIDDRLGCLPPPPSEHRFAWKNDRYARVTALGLRSGCH